MSNVVNTSSARQEACSLVLGGLESLRKGLIKYHELELTTKEIYADLKAAGWDKSIHFLRRQETAMRKEGLLPESNLSKAATQRESVRKTAHEPVENFTPTFEPAPIVQKLEPQDELRTIEYTSLAPLPVRHLEPGEGTSDLYNSLLPHLDFLYQQIVLGRPDFTAEEWCSIAGSLRGLTHAVQPKIDHLKADERDRVESISVDAAEAS